MPSRLLAGGSPRHVAPREAWAGVCWGPQAPDLQVLPDPSAPCGARNPALVRQGSAPTAHLSRSPIHARAQQHGRSVLYLHHKGLPVTSGLMTSTFCLQTRVSLGLKPAVQRPRNPFSWLTLHRDGKASLGDELKRNW